jgi:SAM-dependent methyltransferase
VSVLDEGVSGAGVGVLDPDLACPNCASRGLEIFHEQREIPVHSVRLVDTREEALSFPRGSLALGFCGACGFITNTAYDASLQDYGVSYEETQGFSPTFNAWANDLAGRWVRRWGLEGKNVLEIGCGKGEFLISMVEQGAGHGVGIDPSFLPERVDTAVADRLTFIKDYYSEQYGHLTGDAVVCRHTLEHIAPTLDFMGIVRRSLEGRNETAVLFELPDVLRVLRETAFWDIYYEHCTYFTPGSLARLYRRSGFEVLDLALEYDGQYILIEGRPVDEPSTAVHPLEETVEEVADAVRGFTRSFAEVRAGWRERLAAARAEGKRAVIWGGGSKGVSFLTTLGIGEEIGCAVDINPFKQDKYMAGTGHQVVSPESLREYRPDLVIAMNSIYLPEIGAQLSELGVEAELIGA